MHPRYPIACSATRPLLGIVDRLAAGFDKYGTQVELQQYLRDVADHATTAAERVAGFRQNLSDILTLNATLVSQAQNEEIRRLTITSLEQNEEVKRISAWAAILFAPTLIGTIYGMNFVNMPFLHSELGFWLSLVLMFAVSVALWVIFRRRGWL
jgi:magnesium transporter